MAEQNADLTHEERIQNFAVGLFLADLSEMLNIHGRVLEYGSTDPEVSRAIAKCMDRNASIGMPKGELVTFDVMQVRSPLDQIYGPFHAIVTRGLQTVTNPGNHLAELRRWLEPGGALVLQFPAMWPKCSFTRHSATADIWRFTETGIAFLLTFAGFHVDGIHTYTATLGVSIGYAVGKAK
jgi:hypothetical protein